VHTVALQRFLFFLQILCVSLPTVVFMVYTAHKLAKISQAKKLRQEEQEKKKKQKETARKQREAARKKAAIDELRRRAESGPPGLKTWFLKLFCGMCINLGSTLSVYGDVSRLSGHALHNHFQSRDVPTETCIFYYLKIKLLFTWRKPLKPVTWFKPVVLNCEETPPQRSVSKFPGARALTRPTTWKV